MSVVVVVSAFAPGVLIVFSHVFGGFRHRFIAAWAAESKWVATNIESPKLRKGPNFEVLRPWTQIPLPKELRASRGLLPDCGTERRLLAPLLQGRGGGLLE